MDKNVTWRGLTASYDRSERQIMSALTVREQGFVHGLKAAFTGEISESVTGQQGGAIPQARIAVNEPAVNRAPTQYTEPEDIPFGDAKFFATKTLQQIERQSTQNEANLGPVSNIDKGYKPRKRSIYALCWTWQKSRVYKTKAKAEVKKRAWKRWYERNGWKVTSHQTGYFATKGKEQHSISLHEYDRDTKERLK